MSEIEFNKQLQKYGTVMALTAAGLTVAIAAIGILFIYIIF